MAPNPFIIRVIAKAVASISKSAMKAYQNALKKNNAASGKTSFKFDINDLLKHHKLNIQKYINTSKLNQYSIFNEMAENITGTQQEQPSMQSLHKISQLESAKILGIEEGTKLTLQLVMEQYSILYPKNNPKNGGSAYLQSKIQNAKEMLVDQLGGVEAEKKWREENNFFNEDNINFDQKSDEDKGQQDDNEGKQQETQDNQKDQQENKK